MGIQKLRFFSCFAVFLAATNAYTADAITIDQLHLHFVEGIHQGENKKRDAIEVVKQKLNEIELYGVPNRAEPRANENGEADAPKPKSKATLAKEARDKAKKEKRDKLEADKKKAEAIAGLKSEVKKLSDQPADWVLPVIIIEDPKLGSIGRVDHLTFYVIQSINDETALMTWGDEMTFYVKGLSPDSQLIDGQRTTIPGLVVVDPPTRYQTALGSTKTVRTLRRLNAEEQKDLVKYVAKQLAASQPASVESPDSSAESK